MAHNDFALEHNVHLDSMGRKIPQATRKRPVRGAPSAAAAPDEEGGSEDTPELRLLAYDYLPDYTSSDHRPVFARFRARVPTSWFQLPVRFIQPLCRGRPFTIFAFSLLHTFFFFSFLPPSSKVLFYWAKRLLVST